MYRFLFTVFLFLASFACADIPREDLYFNSLGPRADYISVFRPYDNKQYKIYPGIGCMMALFGDLKNDTSIYITKLGDLLAPYDNGNIALLYIQTPYHNVQCKVVDVRPY